MPSPPESEPPPSFSTSISRSSSCISFPSILAGELDDNDVMSRGVSCEDACESDLGRVAKRPLLGDVRGGPACSSRIPMIEEIRNGGLNCGCESMDSRPASGECGPLVESGAVAVVGGMMEVRVDPAEEGRGRPTTEWWSKMMAVMVTIGGAEDRSLGRSYWRQIQLTRFRRCQPAREEAKLSDWIGWMHWNNVGYEGFGGIINAWKDCCDADETTKIINNTFVVVVCEMMLMIIITIIIIIMTKRLLARVVTIQHLAPTIQLSI